MKNTDDARSLAEIALSNMPALIDKIRYRRKPIDLQACYNHLSGEHVALAVCDYFVEGNLQGFKQHLHVATKLSLASIAIKSYQRLETGHEIYFALLSDSCAVIEEIACIEPPYFMSACHDPLNSYFKTHMWQLAIRGDYEALQIKIDKLAKNGRKADRAPALKGEDFFSLLIKGDKQGLENMILREARKQTGDPLVEDFIAEISTYRAKLCWLKGIPVQIDSPLVPMALMPIEPLAHYDDVYDFLQPGYVPPPQGILDKVSHWLKKGA